MSDKARSIGDILGHWGIGCLGPRGGEVPRGDQCAEAGAIIATRVPSTKRVERCAEPGCGCVTRGRSWGADWISKDRG